MGERGKENFNWPSTDYKLKREHFTTQKIRRQK